jgi:4-aminobutyrate aminotransferase-like enzyme
MKEIFPPGPAPIVRNEAQRVQNYFEIRRSVLRRFDLAFSRGSGSYLWDVGGKRYLT